MPWYITAFQSSPVRIWKGRRKWFRFIQTGKWLWILRIRHCAGNFRHAVFILLERCLCFNLYSFLFSMSHCLQIYAEREEREQVFWVCDKPKFHISIETCYQYVLSLRHECAFIPKSINVDIEKTNFKVHWKFLVGLQKSIPVLSPITGGVALSCFHLHNV